jgi:hypothetical protein
VQVQVQVVCVGATLALSQHHVVHVRLADGLHSDDTV